jgi:predicted O-linked N-acetylglucosamine transferase (SPINDLY family)
MSIGEAAVRAWQCHQAGDLRQAESLYRYIIAEAANQLGIVSAQQGKLEEAAASFRQALTCCNDAGVLSNLGNALRMQGKLDEAEDCARMAVANQPDNAESHSNLGLILMKEGKLQEAQACFRKAVQLKPDYAVAHSNLLLCLNYDPHADAETVFAEHRLWAECHGRAPASRPSKTQGVPQQRLRIGYVSPDLCEHVVASFMASIFRHHDPAQVEIFCYAEVIQPDRITQRFQQLAAGWRSTCALGDAQVAEMIRGDGIDILVDLAGHTGGNRLGVFAHKPAPVQATYLGYPATTGLPAIDYRLTDAVADPPGEPCRYTEELIRLPGCFCCYEPLPTAPPVAPLPALRQGHVTFGSLHDLAKVNADVIALWCRVLQAAPTTRLLMFRHTLRSKTLESFRQRFLDGGISPERVELAHATDSGPGYLGLYAGVDILLDVFPWTGHATTCEALWQGVPVVTLAGTCHAGRLSATVLRALRLDDLVTTAPDQYVDVAAKLAGDLDQLTRLRAGLRERMRASPLCDGVRFTRNLEAAYRSMWQRRCMQGA